MLSKQVKLVVPDKETRPYQLASGILNPIVKIGPNFRASKWQKRIATVIKKSIRQPTDEESLAIAIAQNFVTAQLRKIGCTEIPFCIGLLTDAHRKKHNGTSELDSVNGSAHATSRSMYLRRGLVSENPLKGENTIAHEFLHLTGLIRLSQTSWLSMGLVLNAPKNVRFSVLEEFVISMVANRHLKEQGTIEYMVPRDISLGEPSANIFTSIFNILHGEIYQTEAYISICKKNSVKTLCQDFAKAERFNSILYRLGVHELFPKQVSLPSLHYYKDGKDLSSGYSVVLQSMLDLSKEVADFYSGKAFQREHFEDLLLSYHQSGNLRAALRYLSHALGKSIYKPLAFLNSRFYSDNPEYVRDNILFRMYVDAVRIPDIELRNSVRNSIAFLTQHREQITFNCRRT